MLEFLKKILTSDKKKDEHDLCTHADMIFYGTQYGGWHVPISMTLTDQDVCYCIGAGEDISFDCALAMNYPCHVHIFDPTPRAITHFNDLHEAVLLGHPFAINKGNENYTITQEAMQRVHFHPWGIADQDGESRFYLPKNPDHVSCSIVNLQKTNNYFSAICVTVASAMHKLKHDNVALMKMDIEGAEHGAIKQMLNDGIKPRILSIEFDELHTRLDDHSPSRVAATISRLQQHGYTLIFKNSHNYTFSIL